ncbi:hypothetical protein [Actinoplanes palleronii]|uniref:Uncharacterized protein n=1 Tax=Actinoplanes palleronii TaxID=113570 RepID=A0ABQ4B443_9ACTN|nr:hypothetical protein [Actinoplanes palleronii]GIE65367.1 hypothetical protein Apa02nite_014750 [Actinoplanes palleronii]
MTQPTVPERKALRADEVTRGDWIAPREAEDYPVETLATVDFDTVQRGPEVELIYRQADGRLGHWTLTPGATVLLATDDEVSDWRRNGRRSEFVDQLRACADMLSGTVLPMPANEYDKAEIRIAAKNVAEVAEIARTLGVEVEIDSANRHSAFFRPLGKASAVAIEWFDYDRTPKAKPVDPTGLAYSREADEVDAVRPISPGRGGAPQVGAMTDGGLVDETPVEPVTRYFSFGGGHTDPLTGESLIDKYVTIIAEDGEACRLAMLAKYGKRWSFEYIPGTPQADEWIPRWVEHARFDLTANPRPAGWFAAAVTAPVDDPTAVDCVHPWHSTVVGDEPVEPTCPACGDHAHAVSES